VAPVRRFLEEFKNHANIDIVDETWTPDAVLHVTGFPLPPGRDAQKNVGRTVFAAFGDVHVEVDDTIVEGDRVVERHTAHAVHKGEFMGIPATGKKVFWTENHIYRIADGKIAETWSEPSFHDLLAQLRGAKTATQAGN
jgi:predicted ester cyclase